MRKIKGAEGGPVQVERVARRNDTETVLGQ